MHRPLARPNAGFMRQLRWMPQQTAAVAHLRGADVTADIAALVALFDDATDREKVRVVRSAEGHDNLNNYAILAHIDVARKRALVEAAASSNAYNRVMGSMMGMAVGDSIG